MRLYYIAESEGPIHYVRSAVGVDAERWNDLYRRVFDWRMRLQEQCAVPLDRELDAGDLLSGRGMLAHCCGADHNLTPEHGTQIFLDGLRVIETAAKAVGGVDVINVCLRKQDVKRYERVSLDRLLNRINTSVAAAERHAFLIFPAGTDEAAAHLYHRLRSRNRVPSRYEAWEDGERTKDIPIDRVIGGPVFRSRGSDYMLQMAGLVAHALLEREQPSSGMEERGVARGFYVLHRALNRRASRQDPQGIVRR